jgi:hypothetical protein
MHKSPSKTGPSGGARVLLFAFFILYFALPVHAASGTEAASFLDIPVGAGPAALGGAYSALATDAYAPTWNPGALGFVDSTQLSGQHLSYLESIDYEYFSFVRPLHSGGTWGGAVQYLGSGNITGTDNSGNSTGDFSSHYAAYALSYGHSLGEKLSLGFTGKVIDAKIAAVSAHAFAGDLGSFYKLNDDFSLAAVLTNVGTKLTFLDDGGSLPLAFKLGAAYKPNADWTLSTEGEYDQTGLLSGHAGLEWRPVSMIAIRAGYRTDTTQELGAFAGFSTGLGLNLWGQEFAYAWVPYGDLGNTQYFSLLIRFGQLEREKRNLIEYHHIKSNRSADDTDPRSPEYMQLMQMLSDQDRELTTKRPATSEAAQ